VHLKQKVSPDHRHYEAAYFKCHRILDEYMDGNATNSMEIAKSIRPSLKVICIGDIQDK